MILVNRESELASLEKAYHSEKAEFLVIYGRRRLGKTFLVKNFIKDKEHFYFLAKQQNLELEFSRFKEKIGKKFNIYFEGGNWEELFTEIVQKIKTGHKLIIVIDEFPYWIIKDKSIPSEFQYLWDEVLKDEKIMLILIGSYISVMEQDVIGYKSPLYGRKTGQLLLHPMSVASLHKFLPNYSLEELIKTYGAADTLPYYLAFFNPGMSFKENLRKFFDTAHPFYNDAEVILSSELREYNTYFNIMKAVLDGATTLSEISSKSKVDITNISKYIKVLVDMKLLRKIKPITSPAKEKRYVYEVYDNYFRFWLKYVFPYKEEVEEDPESHLNYVLKNYSDYLGKIFEKFCFKITPILFPKFKVGRWWHKDTEIDLVALNEPKKEILFGECKWQENVNAKKVLKELKEKTELVQWHNEERKELFVLFAKSFKEKIKSFEGKKVYCFDLRDLEDIIKPQ